MAVLRLLILVVLTVIICSTSTTAAAPVKVTATLQRAAITNLRKALAAKPDAVKNDEQFKAALIKWIQDTDAQVLRSLVPRIQRPARSCASPARTSKPYTKVSRLGQQYPSYEDSIPPQLIIKRLEAMSNETSGAQLKIFLEAMNTTEGQKAVKSLNIKQTILDELLKQINGNEEQQTRARGTFRVLVQSITQKELPTVRLIYKIYLQYALRLRASEVVKKSNPEQMKALLEVLSKAEKRYKFSGIRFSSLLSQAKTDAGRVKAVETLTKWIGKADIKNLRRVVHYIQASASPPGKTLEEIKVIISKKVESKSSAQLMEFLEVLETADGKVLVGKLSVKLAPPAQDLIKKLKSGVKTDEAAVKKSLQDWIKKLTVNDMKEFQKSRQLFLQYRARKAALEGLQRADQATLLKILTYLAKKESSGVKFEGIKVTDLKNKLEKDGSKALEETRKAMMDWVSKVKFDQLIALRGAHPDVSHSSGPKATGTIKAATVVKLSNKTAQVKKPVKAPVNKSTTVKPATKNNKKPAAKSSKKTKQAAKKTKQSKKTNQAAKKAKQAQAKKTNQAAKKAKQAQSKKTNQAAKKTKQAQAKKTKQAAKKTKQAQSKKTKQAQSKKTKQAAKKTKQSRKRKTKQAVRPVRTTTQAAAAAALKATTKKGASKKSVKHAAQSKQTKKVGVKKTAVGVKTISSLSEVKSAILFQQFMLKKSSTVTVSHNNVRKALIQVCTSGTNDDISTIFALTDKGMAGHAAKLLSEGLFKVQVVRTNNRIKKATSASEWSSLRVNLKKWLSKWKKNQISLFTIWYKRGAESKRK